MARRFWLTWICAGVLLAQQAPAPPPAEQNPPEEDLAEADTKEYAFNPLQADKEVKIGHFYMKKQSWKAATQRFREATRWNPGLAEAWLRLGECLEKGKDTKGAQAAYRKYLELEPEGKSASMVKKKLGS